MMLHAKQNSFRKKPILVNLYGVKVLFIYQCDIKSSFIVV